MQDSLARKPGAASAAVFRPRFGATSSDANDAQHHERETGGDAERCEVGHQVDRALEGGAHAKLVLSHGEGLSAPLQTRMRPARSGESSGSCDPPADAAGGNRLSLLLPPPSPTPRPAFALGATRRQPHPLALTGHHRHAPPRTAQPSGGPCRDRTYDLGIKRSLCSLSPASRRCGFGSRWRVGSARGARCFGWFRWFVVTLG
jgi:hypothetical protein